MEHKKIKSKERRIDEKIDPGPVSCLMATVVGDFARFICTDAVETNGGEPITDWNHFIGTGPFMITDYTNSSSIEYTKNPVYRQADPLNHGNELPYHDLPVFSKVYSA